MKCEGPRSAALGDQVSPTEQESDRGLVAGEAHVYAGTPHAQHHYVRKPGPTKQLLRVDGDDLVTRNSNKQRMPQDSREPHRSWCSPSGLHERPAIPPGRNPSQPAPRSVLGLISHRQRAEHPHFGVLPCRMVGTLAHPPPGPNYFRAPPR